MKTEIIRMPFLAIVMALAAVLASCSNAGAGKSAQVDKVKWQVAAYAVVPAGSVGLEVADPEAYGDILPLRDSYTQEESAKVDELLAHNDSLLSARGYAYQWIDFGAREPLNLVFIESTPLLEQEVEIDSESVSPCYADCLQIAFRFDDRQQWENITTANIGKRIAIGVNGRILTAPCVNSPITQGACSVIVPAEDAPALLPGISLPDTE